MGGHIDDTDIGILILLRMVFGKDLFQHCILVNTFANVIHTEAAIKERAEGFADNFQGALRQAGIPDIEIKAIQSNQDEAYKGILCIPAGMEEDDANLPNWRSTLLQETIKKVCENRYIPYPLQVKDNQKTMLMKFLNFTGIMDRNEARSSRSDLPCIWNVPIIVPTQNRKY